MMCILRRGFAAAMLALPLATLACETDLAAGACVAASMSNRLMFAFPPADAAVEYRWNREQTHTNHLEYEWQVQLGGCRAGRFESNGFVFGVQLFKHDGASETTGSLADLLEVANRAVAKRHESVREVRYSVLTDLAVIAAERDGRVLIGANDAPTVVTLTKTAPSHAKLIRRTPESPEGESCVTALRRD